MSQTWNGTPTGADRPASTGIVRSTAAGIVAAVVGAIIWAVIVEISNYKVGIVAVGIGFLVGMAMAATASTSPRLPVIGAGLALFGCVLGDVFVDANSLGQAIGESTLYVLGQLVQHPNLLPDLVKAGFEPFDLVFWAIATYEGWKLTKAGVRRMQARAVAASQPTAPPEAAAYYPQDGDQPGQPR